MKKNKMYAIVIVLLFAMLFGCSANSAPTSNDTSTGVAFKATQQLPEKLNLYALNTFDSSDGSGETELENWEIYMSDKYKTDINLNQIEDYDATLADISSETVSGLISLRASDMLALIDTGKILPLDDFLKNNASWNALPDDFKNRFLYKGHIWAIPKSTYKQINAASIKTDWLKAEKVSLPNSIESYIEVGKKFLTSDANGDGDKTNDYMFGGYPISAFKYIFSAYGVYISDDKLPINYDPEQNCIADTLLKPTAKQALLTIREMYKSGLIDPDTFTYPYSASEKNSNGEYGTYQGLIDSAKFDLSYTVASAIAEKKGKTLDRTSDFGYTTSFYEALPPLSNHPLTYSEDNMGYVMTANTKDPERTINFFADLVFSSKQSYIDCYIGTPDKYTALGNGAYLAKLKDNITKILPPYPRIVDASQLIMGDRYVLVANASEIDTQREIKNYIQQYKNDYIARYTKTNQLVKIPVMYQIKSKTYDKYREKLSTAFYQLYMSLADDTVSIDTILETYKNTVKNDCYLDDILKESNDYLGLVNK